MYRTMRGAGLGIIVAALSGPVWAAKAPTPAERAAVVQAISDCRKVAEDAARLACYDKAAGAFEQAETKGDVVVVTREHVQQVRRQAFGFSMPSLDLFGGRGSARKEEGFDRLTLEVQGAHKDRDGRWVLEATDGVVWRQTDDQEFFKDPRAGSKLVITHGALSSFFCQIDTLPQIRCARVR